MQTDILLLDCTGKISELFLNTWNEGSLGFRCCEVVHNLDDVLTAAVIWSN